MDDKIDELLIGFYEFKNSRNQHSWNELSGYFYEISIISGYGEILKKMIKEINPGFLSAH